MSSLDPIIRDLLQSELSKLEHWVDFKTRQIIEYHKETEDRIKIHTEGLRVTLNAIDRNYNEIAEHRLDINHIKKLLDEDAKES